MGGPSYSASNGITYIADRYYTGGGTADWHWIDGVDVLGTHDDQIFLDERWGDFQYNIPMANGVYDVTLQLSEMNWSSTEERKITASFEDVVVLQDFDIYRNVGNGMALELPFSNVEVKDGFLTIKMTASADAGVLSGIVVRRSSGAGGVITVPEVIPDSSATASAPPPPAFIPDSTVLGSPVGLTHTDLSDSRVTLVWQTGSNNSGVTGYEIFRNGARIGSTSAQVLTYTDQGLTADTTYKYEVRSIGALNSQSAFSVASVKTYNLSGILALSWNAPITNAVVSGYVVRYKLRSASSPIEVILPSNARSYTLPRLNGDYDIDVAALDSKGNYGLFSRVQL